MPVISASGKEQPTLKVFVMHKLEIYPTGGAIVLGYDRGYMDGANFVRIDESSVGISGADFMAIAGYIPDGVETLYAAIKKVAYPKILEFEGITDGVIV